jgi:Predicted membrane protein
VTGDCRSWCLLSVNGVGGSGGGGGGGGGSSGDGCGGGSSSCFCCNSANTVTRMKMAEYAVGMRGTSNEFKLVGKPDDKGARGDIGEHGRVTLNGP